MKHKTLFERMSENARTKTRPAPAAGRRPSRDDVLRQDHAHIADRLEATRQPVKL
jgi:hypothetical protein